MRYLANLSLEALIAFGVYELLSKTSLTDRQLFLIGVALLIARRITPPIGKGWCPYRLFIGLAKWKDTLPNGVVLRMD